MAVQEVLVPDIGDADAVSVIEVQAKVGSEIKKDDPIATLESDKAAMDIPSPAAGKITEVKVKVGDKVGKGALLILLEAKSAAAAPSDKKPTAEIPEPSKPLPPPPAVKGPEKQPNPVGASVAESDGRPAHATPTVRRAARELGVDLARVKATGPKGRILVTDLHAYVKTALADRDAKPRALADFPVIDFSEFGEIEEKPLSRVKKLSGANLARNWAAIPHVTQFDEADITDLEEFRKSMLADAEKRGVKLTLLAFLIKAVVNALKAYPHFNASLSHDGDSIVLKKYYHVGFACDTPDGLVVPVVRDVQNKEVLDIARELAELSVLARERKLKTNHMKGGTFTISSLGGIGGTAFTPIINWPEVAILGVSRAAMKPIYDDKTKNFEPRLMMPLSLTYDHRVIDGADGARFTSHLRMMLSDVRRLLL